MRNWLKLLFCVAAIGLLVQAEDDAVEEHDAGNEAESAEEHDGGHVDEGAGEDNDDGAGHEDGAADESSEDDGHEDVPDEHEEYDAETGSDDNEEPESGSDEGEPEPDNERLDPEKMKVLHTKIDANGDGKISLAEISEFDKTTRRDSMRKTMQEQLESYDMNSDGKVSEEELLSTDDHLGEDASDTERQAFRDFEKAKYKAADQSGDGFLDKEELEAYLYPENFEHVLSLQASHTLKSRDKDGDGMLSPAEYWEMPEEKSEEWQSLMVEFKKYDLDGDGKLNLKEVEVSESGQGYHAEQLAEILEYVDSDKDSHISLAELETPASLEKLSEFGLSHRFHSWSEHHEL